MAEELDTKRSAEEACQRAEELYRAGDIRGALRQAGEAKRLCPSLPAAASALAAYQVVAASDWRAVLGIRPGADAATKDAVKTQFRRLSLLVHPDKNRCAAAEEAFKRLRQALDDALGLPPAKQPEDDRGGSCRSSPSSDQTTTLPEERRTKASIFLIYCPSCKKVFPGRVGALEEKVGIKCAFCPKVLHPPQQNKPPAARQEPPPPRRMGFFPFSWRCPSCDTQHSSTVSVGKSRLRCEVCTEFTIVYA